MMHRVIGRAFGMKVGFVGLGNMGLGMAKNIKNKLTGAQLTCFEASKERRAQLGGEGLQLAQSLKQLRQCQKIVLSLPNGEISRAVCEGPQGLFGLTKKGTVILDSSTIQPAQAKALEGKAKEAGKEYVDCPVSGGVKGAAEGTLCFMVGARDGAQFQQLRGLLGTMGARVIDCGGPGLGQVAKMCNNMAMAVEMIGISEALVLGRENGMSERTLTEVMKVSSSRCWSVDTYNPVPQLGAGLPSSRDYEGGFACDLMLKDLKIGASSQQRSSIVLGKQALQIYESLVRAGRGRKDFGYIYKALRDRQL